MTEIDIPSYEIPDCSEVIDVTAAKTFSGKILTPKQHLLLFDADDWEQFIEEWAQFQKQQYLKVARLGGAFDYGIDVACFKSEKGFQGQWHNFQCKYYKGAPLTPGTALPEIGKVLWHAFKKRITMPQKYFFFAPKDCGASLKKLLLDAPTLTQHLFEKWDDWCKDSITSTQSVELDGEFLEFVKDQSFEVFQYKPTHEVIEEHRQTPFFIPRFGGGLPDRPKSEKPPEEIAEIEARYVDQLFEAYSDALQSCISSENLGSDAKLEAHFNRQRESFFQAESLKTFARDTVPFGTFESLQEEIFTGVIDICENEFPHGLDRLNNVTNTAKQLALTSNGLIQVTKLQDRQGICHQLANEDRLVWVQDDD